MLRLFFDRFQRVLLSVLVAGLLLLALTLVAGAQPGPSITVTPSADEARLGENVQFNLKYTLPDGSNASPPGVITATWSANGSLMNASERYVEVEGSSEIRWDYREGLPLSTELPSFELKVGKLSDPIVVTATLIVSDSQNLRTIQHRTTSTHSISVVPAEDSMAVVLSGSSLVIDPAETVMAGESIDVIVTVLNTGNASAEDVTVVFTPTIALQSMDIDWPDDVEQLEPTKEGTVAYKLRSPVETGRQHVFQFSAGVPADALGMLEINGKIAAAGGITQSLSSQVEIAPLSRPRLMVQIEGPASVGAGETLNLSLKITNEGQAAAEGIKIKVSTTPAVRLTASDSDGIVAQPGGDDAAIGLDLASLGSGESIEVQLTGHAPVDQGAFFVNAVVSSSSEFDTDSQLESSHQLAVQPLPTLVPTSTEAPGETQAVVTPTVSPTATPPEGESKKAIDSQRLLIVGAVALVAALGAGFLLLFLLRGRGKPKSAQPSVPPASETEPPSSPAVVPTTPLPVSRASLESVSLPGMRLRLEPDVTTIGRAPDSIIRIDERYMNWETVSRQHAEIRREGDYYVIYDVSNSNGVYVEGQRTARNLLRSGWRIGIGGVEFIFHDAAPAGQ